MHSGGCDGDGAFGLRLAFDVGVVGDRRQRSLLGGDGAAAGKPLPAAQVLEHLADRFCRVNLHVLGDRPLGSVVKGDDDLAQAERTGPQHHRQYARQGAQLPAERKLPEDAKPGQICAEGARRLENRQQNRQIVGGPALFPVGGREVQNNPRGGKFQPRVLHRRAHTVPRLLHRRVRQADNLKGGQSAGKVGFHRHRVGVNAGKAKAADGGKHVPFLLSAVFFDRTIVSYYSGFAEKVQSFDAAAEKQK